ncbi:hypothetical protein [Lysinibacillus telephonicus]|uniref:hypothetical protein n=1 Tax=Lysinibacillus telephonicus TaxID=1714840 RepID=UPI00163AA4F9|nr:hypothetical protein [Lysinibacillus telephonicus]
MGKRFEFMEFVITIAIIVIAITCLCMEGNLRKTMEQNNETIELLKQLQQK